MRLELERHNKISTFSADVIPEGVDVITAKYVFAWKTDSDRYTTKAKGRFVERGLEQQSGVDYTNMFAPTPTVSYINVPLTIAVQNDWALYHFDVKQAFVQAPSTPTSTRNSRRFPGRGQERFVKLDHTLWNKADRTTVVGCSLS